MINNKIDLLIPGIFPKDRILSGVTKINRQIFPGTGLSLSPASILSMEECNNHINFFADSIGIPIERIKYQKQIHSDTIVVIDKETPVNEADSLITNEKNILIFVKIADCAGILLYDIKNDVIGAVHSGWRGTQQNITGKTVSDMAEKYSSDPENVLVYISPCASVDNYEVGEDFNEYFPKKAIQKRDGKLYFDNKMMIKEQLLEAGILAGNIEISEICTIANPNYHSYRRDAIKSGRMGVFICMR